MLELEVCTDLVTIPNMLTQLIEQNYLPQAIKLILKYQDHVNYSHTDANESKNETLIDLVNKEVQIHKKHITQILYKELKKSHLNQKTKTYITLLTLLDLKRP